MITAHLIGDGGVLARLRALPNGARSGLVRALTELALNLQRKVQQDELSGEVLFARTGSLKSSIDVQLDQDASTIAATVYSSSEYARVHEFGFVGTVNVRASLRRITEAFGRPISPKTTDVRAHSRKMELPERSFLRSALADMAPAIRGEVDAVLRETLAG